jgi:hypothetical protein
MRKCLESHIKVLYSRLRDGRACFKIFFRMSLTDRIRGGHMFLKDNALEMFRPPKYRI